MIKLVCYGSKTLCLKEAYCSYVGEKKFTTVQIITADEIDGHKVDEFNVELHIIRGVYDDKYPLTFIKNGTTLSTEYTLDSRYTSYARELGFYLKFTKETETGEEIVGLTNAVYLHTVENKKLEEPKDEIDYDSSNSNGSFNGGSNSGSGKDGKDGKNGITYAPSISEDGILSWTNDGGLPNPTPIKVIGKDGTNGKDGANGKDGKDYILTDLDKQNIASIVVDEFDSELLAILGGDSNVTE